MYLMATLNTFDCIDRVHMGVTVRALTDGPDGAWETVFRCSTTIPGEGETDPRQWIKDSLIGMLEAL